jgi:hypothetical protein
MTSPDSSELAQDRTDAATCREAAILLRGRPLTASTSGRMIRALGQLPNAVSLALAADGRSVPPNSATCDVRRCTLLINFSACG